MINTQQNYSTIVLGFTRSVLERMLIFQTHEIIATSILALSWFNKVFYLCRTAFLQYHHVHRIYRSNPQFKSLETFRLSPIDDKIPYSAQLAGQACSVSRQEVCTPFDDLHRGPTPVGWSDAPRDTRECFAYQQAPLCSECRRTQDGAVGESLDVLYSAAHSISVPASVKESEGRD